MKITNISMEVTDAGAVVSFASTEEVTFSCPRCGTEVKANSVHRCGDKAKPVGIAADRKAAKGRRAITGGAR